MSIKKAVLFPLWIVAVGLGFLALNSYSHTPGEPGAAVGAAWPPESKLPAAGPGRYSLVAFIHPRCNCSLATLTEIGNLLSADGDKIDLSLVFYKSHSDSKDWSADRIWQKAQLLPAHHTLIDEDGKEAELFGVLTSGQVLLFNREGRSVFKGGITPSRGATGVSLGRQTILGYLDGKKPWNLTNETPAFGCALGKL